LHIGYFLTIDFSVLEGFFNKRNQHDIAIGIVVKSAMVNLNTCSSKLELMGSRLLSSSTGKRLFLANIVDDLSVKERIFIQIQQVWCSRIHGCCFLISLFLLFSFSGSLFLKLLLPGLFHFSHFSLICFKLLLHDEHLFF